MGMGVTCSRCRSNPPHLGRSRCEPCLVIEREYDAKRRAVGPCVECRKARRKRGSIRCAECLELKAERAAAARNARVLAGLCVTCGADAVDNLTLCDTCREYYRARQELYAEGVAP